MRGSYIFFDKDTAFQGEVSTDHLVLEGVISGDVQASKDVYLKQGAIVQGEISTQKYKIEEGSVHKGRLRMDLEREVKAPSTNMLESNEPRGPVTNNSELPEKNSESEASSPFDSIYKMQETAAQQQEEELATDSSEEQTHTPQRLW